MSVDISVRYLSASALLLCAWAFTFGCKGRFSDNSGARRSQSWWCESWHRSFDRQARQLVAEGYDFVLVSNDAGLFGVALDVRQHQAPMPLPNWADWFRRKNDR